MAGLLIGWLFFLFRLLPRLMLLRDVPSLRPAISSPPDHLRFFRLSGGPGLSSRPLSPITLSRNTICEPIHGSPLVAVPMITIRPAVTSSITLSLSFSFLVSLTIRYFLAWQPCCCPSPVLNAFFPTIRRSCSSHLQCGSIRTYFMPTVPHDSPDSNLFHYPNQKNQKYPDASIPIHSFPLPHALRTSLCGAVELLRGCGAVRETTLQGGEAS